MSDFTIGNYKNKADKDAQLRKFKDYIKLETKLNAKQRQSNTSYYTNIANGTAKPSNAPMYKDSQEEIQDIIRQKQIALENLRSILPYGQDAQKGLGYLSVNILEGTDISEIALFNRHFTEFKKSVSDKNMTPSYFNNIWDRFKVKLAYTQNTGLEIALNHTSLDEQLRQLANGILHNLNELTGITNSKMDKVKQAVLIAIKERDENALRKILKAVEDGNTPVLESIARISSKMYRSDTSMKAETGLEFDEDQLKALNKTELRQILADIVGIENTSVAIADYFGMSKISDVSPSRLIAEIMYKQNFSEGKDDIPAKRKRGRPKKEEGQASSGGAKIPANTPTKTPKKAGRPKGKGLRKVIKGKGLVGIQPIKEPKFIDFGKYLIHVPSLRMNKLNLKYRSKGYINKSKEISDSLRDLIFYVIENGKIEVDLYNKLDDNEKNYFNEVSHKAQIEKGLGIKYDENEKRGKIRRFEILRGEILSGNNNPDIFKELKQLLIEFVDNSTISHRVGFELIKDLGMI